MKRKFLEDLGIEKEAIDKIMAENGKDIEKIKELQEQVNKYSTEIQQRDQQLEELKGSAVNNEELKQTIENLQNQNKELEEQHLQELNNIRIDNAVTNALMKAGAKNIKAVKALLQLENATLSDEGNVNGLSEQIEALVKSDSFLFEKQPQMKGAAPGQSKDGLPRKNTNEMNYTELCAYLEANLNAQI